MPNQRNSQLASFCCPCYNLSLRLSSFKETNLSLQDFEYSEGTNNVYDDILKSQQIWNNSGFSRSENHLNDITKLSFNQIENELIQSNQKNINENVDISSNLECITGKSFIGVENQIDILSSSVTILSKVQPDKEYYLHTCLNCNLKCFLSTSDGEFIAIKNSIIEQPTKLEDPDYSPIFKIRIIPQVISGNDFTNHVVNSNQGRERIPKLCLPIQKEMQKRLLKAKEEMESRIEAFVEIERRCFDRMMRRTCEIERKLLFSRIVEVHYDDTEQTNQTEDEQNDNIIFNNSSIQPNDIKNENHNVLINDFNSSNLIQLNEENYTIDSEKHNSQLSFKTSETSEISQSTQSGSVRRKLFFTESSEEEPITTSIIPDTNNSDSINQNINILDTDYNKDTKNISKDLTNKNVYDSDSNIKHINSTLFEMDGELSDNEQLDSESIHDSQEEELDNNEKSDAWKELRGEDEDDTISSDNQYIQSTQTQSIISSPLTKGKTISKKSKDSDYMMARSLPISILNRNISNNFQKDLNDRYIFEPNVSYIERYSDIKDEIFHKNTETNEQSTENVILSQPIQVEEELKSEVTTPSSLQNVEKIDTNRIYSPSKQEEDIEETDYSDDDTLDVSITGTLDDL